MINNIIFFIEMDIFYLIDNDCVIFFLLDNKKGIFIGVFKGQFIVVIDFEILVFFECIELEDGWQVGFSSFKNEVKFLMEKIVWLVVYYWWWWVLFFIGVMEVEVCSNDFEYDYKFEFVFFELDGWVFNIQCKGNLIVVKSMILVDMDLLDC